MPHGVEYFPALEAVGEHSAQLFKSSPQEGAQSAHLMYLMAISAAKESIRVANAYFIPDSVSRRELIAALRRGVRVQIIVPGKYIDTAVARQASRAHWGELLEAGAEIHEYEPTMIHCKVMIVDSYLVSVGSTNFDNRSFQLNDEANLNIYDSAFAEEQVRIFQQDLQCAKPINLPQWRARPWTERVVEALSGLLARQL